MQVIFLNPMNLTYEQEWIVDLVQAQMLLEQVSIKCLLYPGYGIKFC